MPIELPVQNKQSTRSPSSITTALCLIITALGLLTFAMLPSSGNTGPLHPIDRMEGS